ncbi:MAG: hypothetical protein EA397_06965 [Deltaproteobacteria bacterium]|nr:MAG: hypothetical protein EA397_06965 [Deltaproteobacteria bacterium]
MFGLSLTACGPEPERWGGDNLTTPDQGNVDSDSNSGHDTNGNSGGGNSGGNTTTECHAYDPFQKVGSVRNYAVTSRGDSGTEVQTVLSQGLTPDGRPANRVEVKTEANDQEQTGFFYHACASDGAALKIGANVENTITFDMGLTVFTESLGWIEDMYQPGQRYLPPVADMGSPGQRWSGSYTVHTTVQDSPTSFEVEGQFEELPRGTTTVPAGTFETYQIIYRFEEERGSSDPFGLGDFGFDFGFDMFGFFGNAGEDIDAISELHFAEGIGLVYELTVDAGSGQVIMERSLTSYSIAN